MSSPSKRRPVRQTRPLSLEALECRVVPNVVLIDPPPPPNLPFATNDDLGFNVNLPSSPVPVLANDLNNPGASWNFASLTVVTPPQFGTLSLDATTGVLLYTPTVVPQPPGAPPLPAAPDTFTYHVRNSLGMQTNTASVTLSPVASPSFGYLIARPDIFNTGSHQPIVFDLLANDELRNDPFRPNDPGEVSNWEFDYASVANSWPEFGPTHGTATFNPATGAVTYTPEFGYIGWDQFQYTVSTKPGRPDGPNPGEVWNAGAEVFVIINGGPPRLQADPFGGQMLVVDGTNQADTIVIVPGARKGEVKAIVNGVTSPSFRPTSRIVAFGYGGDDSIIVSPAVRNTTWLVGGTENDLLMAGGGPSLIMGGDGNDSLFGGLARDILIGGAGEDSLTSAFGSDVLIGGSTRFDAQPGALADVFARWAGIDRHSSDDDSGHGRNPKRRDLLTESDVLDDGAKDTLVGRRGADLIFATTTGVVDEVVKRRNPKDWESWHDHEILWRKVGKRLGSYSLMESFS